jgi:hypothetical protein
MVTYDYSNESNNPWDLATWDSQAQIDFMRRMRYKFGGSKGNAEARITQRIAQSDTKGMPPRAIAPVNKVYIIRGKPGAPGAPGAPGGAASNPILGFTGEGPFIANEQFMLAPTPSGMRFPSALAALSSATCLFAPTADSILTLALDAVEYLASGDGVIAQATFNAGSQIGSFTWAPPLSVPASSRLWIVAPAVADPVFGGVQLLFRGDPA